MEPETASETQFLEPTNKKMEKSIHATSLAMSPTRHGYLIGI
jgi:hypothetical protein